MTITQIPAHISISPDILFQALDDEAVLLDMASERYIVLNELGMRMWQLLTENGETAAMIEQLLLEYEVDKNTLSQDILDWIKKLIELGLVSVHD